MSKKIGNEQNRNPKNERRKFIADLIKKFDQIYKTEKDCQEKINRLLYPDGDYICRECKSASVEYEYGERTIKCLKCKKETSLTTHTFFHKIHSARAYLAPIWIMEQGVLLNASEIARVSKVVNSTGQLILKKICLVVTEQLSEVIPYVTSEQMAPIICKRSKETRRRLHPKSEILDAKNSKKQNAGESENRSVVFVPEQQSIDESEKQIAIRGELVFDKLEEKILKVLSHVPLQFESLQEKVKIPTPGLLSALTMLEVSGVISRIPGDLFVKNLSAAYGNGTAISHGLGENERNRSRTITADESKIVNGTDDRKSKIINDTFDSHSACEINGADDRKSIISKQNSGSTNGVMTANGLKKTIRLVKERFHGISRKYLQLYLSAIWVYVDRLRWDEGLLLEACSVFGEICPRKVSKYLSPYSVKAVNVECEID